MQVIMIVQLDNTHSIMESLIYDMLLRYSHFKLLLENKWKLVKIWYLVTKEWQSCCGARRSRSLQQEWWRRGIGRLWWFQSSLPWPSSFLSSVCLLFFLRLGSLAWKYPCKEEEAAFEDDWIRIVGWDSVQMLIYLHLLLLDTWCITFGFVLSY